MAQDQAQTQSSDSSFKLSKFGGMLPAWDDHLLPDGQSASTTNGYLFSGALEPWRVPKLLRNTTLQTPGFVYRLPKKKDAVASALLSVNAPTPPHLFSSAGGRRNRGSA